jgi:hypothetical protein
LDEFGQQSHPVWICQGIAMVRVSLRSAFLALDLALLLPR